MFHRDRWAGAVHPWGQLRGRVRGRCTSRLVSSPGTRGPTTVVGPDRPRCEPRGLPARCGVLLVHLLAHEGALSRMRAACWSRCTAKPVAPWVIRCWRGPTSGRSRAPASRYHRARGKVAGAGLAGLGDGDDRRRPCTPIRVWADRVAGFSPSRRCRWSHAAGPGSSN